MKQKRKIHEISDDENNALANASFNSNDKNTLYNISNFLRRMFAIRKSAIENLEPD